MQKVLNLGQMIAFIFPQLLDKQGCVFSWQKYFLELKKVQKSFTEVENSPAHMCLRTWMGTFSHVSDNAARRQTSVGVAEVLINAPPCITSLLEDIQQQSKNHRATVLTAFRK